MNRARDYYEQGNLVEAIYAAEQNIKQSPNDIEERSFFVELLCINGNLDRADRQLDLMMHQYPDSALGIVLLRQLIRATNQRQGCFLSGLIPKFKSEPTFDIKQRLLALIELRSSNIKEAKKLLQTAEKSYTPLSGTYDGKSFALFRDMDDVCAYILEVYTKNGDYYWIPIELVKSVHFHPLKRPIDLLWRSAQIQFIDGEEGTVYIPAIYPNIDETADDALKLGRQTDWLENGPIRGLGQRTFLIGDNAVPMLEIETIEFNCAN